MVYNNQKKAIVCFKDYCFNVELAKSLKEQSRGLMFRESLDPDKGMLFIYDKDHQHGFWMKNVLIPLDIIWTNENGEVVFIKKNFQPCNSNTCETIGPDSPARHVLEVNGGLADEMGLMVGDKLIFDI